MSTAVAVVTPEQKRTRLGSGRKNDVKPEQLQEFSREEVANHCSPDDCWVIICDRVYDITDFLSAHPGGRSIIMMFAGKDCTEEFLDVHSENYLPAFAPDSFIGVVAGSGASLPPPRPRGAGPVNFDSYSILSLKRDVYGLEHEAFRTKVRSFLKKRVVPQYAKFEMKGAVDPSVYADMAKEGFYLTLNLPKEHGGLGLQDFRYNAIVCEELEDVDCGSFFANLGNDMVLSYFTKSCTEEQLRRWMPMLSRGAVIAVAMSEPEVGSDLIKLSCRAERLPNGDGYILNGRKMWISSGTVAELIVVACVTDPKKGAKGISLLVVESNMEGYSCAKRFNKLGRHASDTCLLTMENVKVPQSNLVGEEGMGFIYMMSNLAKERLSIAVGSAAAARRALALTTNYVHGRAAFGGVLGGLQSVQMKLAQLRAEVQVCTTFVDRCISDLAAGDLSAESASMAKAIATECSVRVADNCVQLFGGYGYLKNSPIAKILVDQRVTRIYGGSNEVQMEIVSKGLGFQPQRMNSKL
mmetsp:Transcript_60980/g.114987  ORF Transcript_60980/g.114987 Transcript_60980/m.114987 type:complete len:524 (-) Transcript_60980:246-1817(-)